MFAVVAVLFLLFSLLVLFSGVAIFLPNRWVKRGMALLNGKWADLPYKRWHAVVAFFIACFLLIALTDLAPIQQLQAAQLNKTEQALEKEKQALKAKEKELKQLQAVYRQTLSQRNDFQKQNQQMEIIIKKNEAKIKQLEVQVKTLQGQLAQQQQKKSVAADPQSSQSVPATQKKPSSEAGSGGRSAPVSASGGDRNCDDFHSQAEAQSYFDSHGGSPSNNVDGLDRDHDGIACENLP